MYKINIKVKMADKIKMKNKKLKKLKKNIEGITLIALVVTIIVLLILAGVALNLTIGQNGIFSRAKDATNTWKNAEVNEQLALDEGANLIDSYLNGNGTEEGDITKEKLKIGDYVEYTPDTVGAYSLTSAVSGYTSNQSISQETMKWQIMSINEDGTVDLISETSTSQKVYLFGNLGYNNGVWILNDICSKQYSNKSLGITARSIKIEDIESKLSDKGIQTRNESNLYGTQYGDTFKPINQNTYYPLLYARENGSGVNTDTIKKDGIGRSESYYTTPTTETGTWATSLTATQTNYDLDLTTNNNYFINEEFYNLISKGEYTIASRAANCYSDASDCIGFKLFVVKGSAKKLLGSDLVASYGGSTAFVSWGLGLRPVATLGANIEFTSGDGSIDKPYKISI